MPLYEYQCDTCGHRFEIIQKYSDPPLTTCPKCGGDVRKLLSSPAIQFKGSGFYITDYARPGKSDGDAGAPPKGQGSNTSAEKKTDGAETKTDAKTEPKDTAKSESKSEKSEKPSASKPASD